MEKRQLRILSPVPPDFFSTHFYRYLLTRNARRSLMTERE